jgi:hypothetical protein
MEMPVMYFDTTESPNVYFTTDCSTGIDTYYLQGISVYPNPVKQFVTIETFSDNDFIYEFRSLNGNVILTGKIDRNNYQLNLSPYPNGIYMITIRSKDFVRTEKVIKL